MRCDDGVAILLLGYDIGVVPTMKFATKVKVGDVGDCRLSAPDSLAQ